MITVIIPALNEELTIGKVVRFCFSEPKVTEVIVVDDRSKDRTVEVASAEGALVITSAKLGKGTSMKEGICYATNDVIVFLDGDIDPYPRNTIKTLTQPIIYDKADFVKATFSRNAGRVTELVAKPLLKILYPELASFTQPLSGMIAGKKQLLSKVEFRVDYGVDIGILIDMHKMKARITEVSIGHIQNKSKPWRALAQMSEEVSGAIIHKAFNDKYISSIPVALNAYNRSMWPK